MKKFITLLLVLTGMVSTAMATEYTIYFSPGAGWLQSSATFKLNMKKNADTWKTSDFTETSTGSGIYSATYDADYNQGIQFLRFNPEGTVQWNYSNLITSVPTRDTYYAHNSNTYDSSWNPSDTRPLGAWVMFGNRHITANNDNWDGSSTHNTMTLKAGTTHTYELTVSNKAVKEGTYGFKFKGNGTYDVGDISRVGWPNINLTINDGDGYYDITYTLDELTLAATATASRNKSATLTYKYFVYDYDPAYSPVGIGSITGQRWWNNEMTDDNSDGTYTFSVSNKNLTNGKYGFKVQEEVYDGSSAIEGYGCLLNTNDLSTDNGYKTTNISKNRAYNVTFSVTPGANNYEMSASNFGITASAIETGYYFIKNDGSGWKVGDILTETGTNIWEGTFSNMANTYFAIIPADDLGNGAADFKWDNAVRPKEGTYDTPKTISFQDYPDQDVENNNGVWKIASTNDADMTVTYNKSTSKWSVESYYAREIKAAADNYATFSATQAVAIPENVTAKYANSVTSGTINWTAFEKGIPANTGALLHATAAGTYKFTPATTTDDVTSNLMKPITTTSQLAQVTESGYTNFILSKVDDVLGFYKPASGAGSWCGAGTAYLQVANGVIGARGFFGLDDETTSIEAVKKELKMNGEYYNLAGQRVAQPAKGLYIVNGKKVVIK